ncbi:alcohol dehydrogenase catalytic domain-containing protein [Curtobacterium sp. Leaf261]|uniref:alcohol dehydrogenase catalytic domain-containing protein n=1 Tax=Curtobacterium sp. Leaf261 TaxID=1736311 RepID=UPI0019100D4D|nr:alcohol dehydrogenase catalytic domain-containing protein [Curtobacterium sp. Leaf261]
MSATMRAAVVFEPGGPFTVRDDVVRRDPGPDEAVVRIRAAGLCHTDLSLARGDFGQPLPAVLGHEGAGEVIAVGADVTDVRVGDRVVLSWVPACGHCSACRAGQPYICRNRPRSADQGAALSVGDTPVVAGMGTATLATETVVPARSLMPLPDDVPFEVGALLGCAVPTGFGAAVDTAGVRPGETVLVIGAGAVGLNAVQGARIAGASLIAVVDPDPARRRLAESLGSIVTAAPGERGPSTAVETGGGFDVAIDAVGVSGTIRSAWDATRRGGRVVVVGAGRADDMVSFSAQELFHEAKSITGSFYGSSDMRVQVPRMTELWRTGQLRLDAFLERVVPLEGLEAAAAEQRAGQVLRVIVTP